MELISEENRIYWKNEAGETVAFITFPEISEGLVEINHTFVDDSLRGQGVAGRLMNAAADQIRSQGKKAVATCSYAVGWFEKHPEYTDILEQNR